MHALGATIKFSTPAVLTCKDAFNVRSSEEKSCVFLHYDLAPRSCRAITLKSASPAKHPAQMAHDISSCKKAVPITGKFEDTLMLICGSSLTSHIPECQGGAHVFTSAVRIGLIPFNSFHAPLVDKAAAPKNGTGASPRASSNKLISQYQMHSSLMLRHHWVHLNAA